MLKVIERGEVSEELSQMRALRVQVCVLTHKRPELLRRAIRSLLLQASCGLGRFKPTCDLGPLDLSILIIDNDAAMSGQRIFEEWAGTTMPRLSYISHPERGIASARNRALEASQEADFVAFLDDDETADADWLAHLVEAMYRFGADVVTGPVLPHHENSPEWVKRGHFFEQKQRKTGTAVPFVATNNVLLRREIVRDFRFDPRFNATGGEDTEFFMRIKRAGHRLVWTREAAVTETVPAERANLAWILSRARSDANRHTRSCLSFDSGFRRRAERCITACGGFVVGVSLLPLVLFGRHHAARGLQLIFRSAGTLSALLGQTQIYYKVSDD